MNDIKQYYIHQNSWKIFKLEHQIITKHLRFYCVTCSAINNKIASIHSMYDKAE